MVAVAVLAVLVGAVIGLTTHIRAQANIQLAKSTITLLGTALEQYYDYWHDYPPDCNDIDNTVDLQTILKVNPIDIWTKQDSASAKVNAPSASLSAVELQSYTGIGIAVYYLNINGMSKQIIGKLNESVLTTITANKSKMGLSIDSVDYPFYYVADPWKTPLRYSRTWVDPTQSRTAANFKGYTKDFPKLESAGPDKKFDTEDDITSKEN